MTKLFQCELCEKTIPATAVRGWWRVIPPKAPLQEVFTAYVDLCSSGCAVEFFGREKDERAKFLQARVEKALDASRAENAEHAGATSERLTRLTDALRRHGIEVD